MKRTWPLILLIGAIGCGPTPAPPKGTPAVAADTGAVWKRVEFPTVADNVRNDTLLVQVSFDLGDGTYMMVASNVQENRDGLRLVHYRPTADSAAQVIASSKPGYDSFTLYPTFFTTGRAEDGLLILANMGEKQSWGQDVFWLHDGHFADLGFLDAAERGWRTYADSLQQWRTSIAERAIVRGGNGQFEIAFSGDSLQLYDDQRGHLEVMYPTAAVRYRCAAGKAELLIDGEVAKPGAPA